MIVYKPVSDIHAMSFDLDDTLYNNTPYIMLAEQYLLTYIAEYYPEAAHISKSEWQKFKLAALKEAPNLQHDMGMLRTVTLTKGFIYAGLNSNDIPDAVSDCFDVFYRQRSNFKIDNRIRKVLSYLRKKIPIVAITNGNVDCERIGIQKYFSHILQAGKDGKMKPSADMFDKASALLGMSPRNILHVGDNLEKDVSGALEAGFKSAWFAVDRPMRINNEQTTVLPHLQLRSLGELKWIAKNFT